MSQKPGRSCARGASAPSENNCFASSALSNQSSTMPSAFGEETNAAPSYSSEAPGGADGIPSSVVSRMRLQYITRLNFAPTVLNWLANTACERQVRGQSSALIEGLRLAR